MSHWNNRIMKYDEDGSLGIHEVFYDDEGKINGWTEDAISVSGNDLEDIKLGYEQIAKAFDAPVLDYKTGKEI